MTSTEVAIQSQINNIFMSIFYRKEEHRETLFVKNLHLKQCKKLLAKILPENSSDDEFVSLFQECFPHIWEDISMFCEARKKDYYRRKSKNQRTVPYYTPQKYLLLKCKKPKNCGSESSIEDVAKQRALLVQKGQAKLLNRKKKLEKNLIYVQEICPNYVKKLITAYHKIRKKDTLNVNARYLILLEASQFKCKETLSFLQRVNACDKNRDLRLMAFYALQRMGEHPWLARERQGKKHLSQLKRIDIKKNPTELLDLLQKYQDLLYQTFDVFLSHSSRDVNELLRIKSVLNRQGYVVYIDWVNDREMLNRTNQDDNTWNALYQRMDQSRRLLYVMTDNSILSDCTEREVLYFKNKNKPVFVYQPNAISISKPDYLKDCEEIKNIEFVTF